MSEIIEVEVLKPEVVAAELAKVTQSAGLAEDSALALRGQFADYYNEIAAWREKAAMVVDPTAAADQKIAREVRLGLRKVRCEVENVRKALKADSLARGKAIDGFANVLKYLCEPIEDKLLAVEQYAERQEAERIAAIVADRTRQLAELECDPSAYNLGAMNEETWVLVLAAAAQNRRNRIEAERQAEADRVARENADHIAREKAEKDAAAARAEAEKERKAREAADKKAEAVRVAAAEEARKAKAAADAKAKVEREKAEAKLRAEREAREAAEREARNAKAREEQAAHQRKMDAEWEREQAEKKAKAEKDAADKAARAPDKAKVLAFAATVRNLAIPHCTTGAGAAACQNIDAKCEQFAVWIEKQAEAL